MAQGLSWAPTCSPAIPPVPHVLPIIQDLNYLSGVTATSGASEQDRPALPGAHPGGKSHGQAGYTEVDRPAAPRGQEQPGGKPVRDEALRSHRSCFLAQARDFRAASTSCWISGPLGQARTSTSGKGPCKRNHSGHHPSKGFLGPSPQGAPCPQAAQWGRERQCGTWQAEGGRHLLRFPAAGVRWGGGAYRPLTTGGVLGALGLAGTYS